MNFLIVYSMYFLKTSYSVNHNMRIGYSKHFYNTHYFQVSII